MIIIAHYLKPFFKNVPHNTKLRKYKIKMCTHFLSIWISVRQPKKVYVSLFYVTVKPKIKASPGSRKGQSSLLTRSIRSLFHSLQHVGLKMEKKSCNILLYFPFCHFTIMCPDRLCEKSITLSWTCIKLWFKPGLFHRKNIAEKTFLYSFNIMQYAEK